MADSTNHHKPHHKGTHAMSTHSYIGILNKDNTVTAVYCHFDGQQNYTGEILREAYDTEEKVRALLALGCLSSLGPRLAPDEGEQHDYLNRAPGVCMFYGRDMKRNPDPAFKVNSEEELFNQARHGHIHYMYVFQPESNKWLSDHCYGGM